MTILEQLRNYTLHLRIYKVIFNLIINRFDIILYYIILLIIFSETKLSLTKTNANMTAELDSSQKTVAYLQEQLQATITKNEVCVTKKMNVNVYGI